MRLHGAVPRAHAVWLNVSEYSFILESAFNMDG